MKTSKSLTVLFLFLVQLAFGQAFLQQHGVSYTMPLLTKTPKGDMLLSWTEKDAKGMTSFCMAASVDNGKTFTNKKTIASGYGIGNSRLMRARLLSKKDGTLVAVFMNNPTATAPASGGRGGKGAELSYCVSKDNGATWTKPQAVDTDPTKNLMRGFFDATVLANDEIAVAYLKDVKGSTKFEERDLRLAVTKDGVFQPEKLVDAVVCDCCNIGLLVDAKGTLNIFYRDNNDNIRDIAKVSSTDNGQTFSKSSIVYKDNWQINGCPHNGASAVAMGNTNLVTWFSAADSEKGIRLVTQEGKKLALIDDLTAKNFAIAADANSGIFFWEQVNPTTNTPQIAYKVINKNVSDTKWFSQTNSGNITALVTGNDVVVAYEARRADNTTQIEIGRVQL